MAWMLGLFLVLSGFSLALCLAAVSLAVIAVDTKQSAERLLLIQVAQTARAEKEAVAAKEERVALARAIESNSLPWFPKNEKLEARYENEALDRLENPSFYSDVVDGLGR